MRGSLLRSLILIAIGVTASVAAPIQYTIQFGLSSGGLAPSAGSFQYDASTELFSNFLVTWQGTQYDLTASANSPYVEGTSCGGSNAASTFLLMTTPNPCGPETQLVVWYATLWQGNTYNFQFQGQAVSDLIRVFTGTNIIGTSYPTGTFSVTQETPEPAAGMLALGGGAVMLLLRRRARNR